MQPNCLHDNSALTQSGHRLAAAHSSSADKAASRSTSTSPTSDCSRRTRPASTACRRSGWMAMSMQLHYLRLLLSCLEFRRATGYQCPHRTPRAFLSTCSGRCLPKRPNDSKQGLCSYGRTFVQKLDAGSVPCSATNPKPQPETVGVFLFALLSPPACNHVHPEAKKIGRLVANPTNHCFNRTHGALR